MILRFVDYFSGFINSLKSYSGTLFKKNFLMNKFMVPSPAEFYVAHNGEVVHWFVVPGAPFPYLHLPPPEDQK